MVPTAFSESVTKFEAPLILLRVRPKVSAFSDSVSVAAAIATVVLVAPPGMTTVAGVVTGVKSPATARSGAPVAGVRKFVTYWKLTGESQALESETVKL